jgi:polyhydroxybutyrate depolymerase
MRRLSLLGILLLLTACSAEGDAEPGADVSSSSRPVVLETDTPSSELTAPVAGDHHLSVTLPDGDERDYLLHAPPNVERGRPLPLVLVFHGLPGSPEDMVRITRFNELADGQGFLVVYPNYFAVDDVEPLLDHLAGIWPIDPRRIYASGFSRGAATTYELTEEAADRIAAFAPISGIAFGLEPNGPTSLIAIQGAEDDFATDFPTVNKQWSHAAECQPAETSRTTFAARPTVRSVARCRAGTEHVVYRVERMGHAWPRPTTRLIWEFFQAHPLPRG